MEYEIVPVSSQPELEFALQSFSAIRPKKSHQQLRRSKQKDFYFFRKWRQKVVSPNNPRCDKIIPKVKWLSSSFLSFSWRRRRVKVTIQTSLFLFVKKKTESPREESSKSTFSPGEVTRKYKVLLQVALPTATVLPPTPPTPPSTLTRFVYALSLSLSQVTTPLNFVLHQNLHRVDPFTSSHLNKYLSIWKVI